MFLYFYICIKYKKMIGIGYISLVIGNIIYMNGCSGRGGGSAPAASSNANSIDKLSIDLADLSENISTEFTMLSKTLTNENELEIFSTLYNKLYEYLKLKNSKSSKKAFMTIYNDMDSPSVNAYSSVYGTAASASVDVAIAAYALVNATAANEGFAAAYESAAAAYASAASAAAAAAYAAVNAFTAVAATSTVAAADVAKLIHLFNKFASKCKKFEKEIIFPDKKK